jgi:hypothetical protein
MQQHHDPAVVAFPSTLGGGGGGVGPGEGVVYAAFGPDHAHSARTFANATVAWDDGQARSLTH